VNDPMGKKGHGCLVKKMITCKLPQGKKCKCLDPNNPLPHGPYFYFVTRANGQQTWIYLGKPHQALYNLFTSESFCNLDKSWQDSIITKFRNLTNSSKVDKSDIVDILPTFEWEDGKLKIKVEETS